MSRSVARSEQILERLGNRLGLSEPAKQWLTVALDPFHDNPTNCTGLPDSCLGNSVVQCIKNSVTIAAPPDVVAAEGNWDVHVSMLPFTVNSAQPLSFMIANNTQGNLLVQQASVTPFRRAAPITITAYPTGDLSGYSNQFQAGIASDGAHQTTVLELPGNFSTGEYRILAQGFEVINTTAELYSQGLATIYRTPVPTLTSASGTTIVYDDGAAVQGTASADCLYMSRLPQSPQEALALPNTKQWKAKEGCYVVGRFNDEIPSTRNDSFVQPCFRRRNVNVQTEEIYMPVTIANTVRGETYRSCRELQWANMDISGGFFTGLNFQSTLTINWNIYIERFPSIYENDLIVLAKPSPAFDPLFFEVYKAISQDMPVGCMQKENGLGDWFRDAVSTVADVVTPVLSMIPHPAAQAAAGVGRAFMSKPKEAPARRESESPYVSESQEKAFISRPRIARSPVRTVKHEIKQEAKKEIKKEIKKEVKPFLRRSAMSVIPPKKGVRR